jgi:hypothetical protein
MIVDLHSDRWTAGFRRYSFSPLLSDISSSPNSNCIYVRSTTPRSIRILRPNHYLLNNVECSLINLAMSCPYKPNSAPFTQQTDAFTENANEPIPQPSIHWFTKNIPDVNPNFPMESIWRLADIYGPIYKLDFVTNQVLVLSSHELINEVCDEDRFEKSIVGALKETRALLGDGLFTAYPDEDVG